jgi:glycosyltransferase involved in cell wall biosynthesis
MKLTVVEPLATGHHMVYARYIIREAVARGWNVQLLTSEAALESDSCRRILKAGGDQLTTALMPLIEFPRERATALNIWRYQRTYHRALGKAFRRARRDQEPDVVFCINLDDFDKALAVYGSPFGRVPFGGALMRLAYLYSDLGIEAPKSRRDLPLKWLFGRMLRVRTLRTLITIDEPLWDYVCENPFRGSDKIRFVYDPVEMECSLTREKARGDLHIPADRLLVLVYGGQTRRKGIQELMAGLSHPSCPRHIAVLLAGRVSEDMQAYLGSAEIAALRTEKRLYQIEGFLGKEDENRAFSAADIVWMGYRGHWGMSGVLVQAGRMGLPIVACRAGLIGWLSEKHKLGEIVDERDPVAVATALSRLANNADLCSHYGRNGAAMASKHEAERFAETICNALEEHARSNPQ